MMKEMLLESQVSNMEEVLKENSIESDFRRKELFKNPISWTFLSLNPHFSLNTHVLTYSLINLNQ